MNFRTLNARHIWLISLHWSRHAVRSGAGLVYLLIALTFGLSVAQMVIMPVEQLMIISGTRSRMAETISYTTSGSQVGRCPHPGLWSRK